MVWMGQTIASVNSNLLEYGLRETYRIKLGSERR